MRLCSNTTCAPFSSTRAMVSLQGIVQQRRCRDVLWLLLFMAFWIGMFVVCGVGLSKGKENDAHARAEAVHAFRQP